MLNQQQLKLLPHPLLYAEFGTQTCQDSRREGALGCQARIPPPAGVLLSSDVAARFHDLRNPSELDMLL